MMKMSHSNRHLPYTEKISFTITTKRYFTKGGLLVLLSIFVLVLLHSHAQSQKLPYGLQAFKNIEQIEYCVPLPLSEFTEKSDVERAHHSFVHKKDSLVSIELRGYYCDDKKITLEKLFTESYATEDEERGKIITKKEIKKDRHCFYAIGYYNNFISKYAFFEITWVKKDEVVVLQIQYLSKQQNLWMQRLQAIMLYAGCP